MVQHSTELRQDGKGDKERTRVRVICQVPQHGGQLPGWKVKQSEQTRVRVLNCEEWHVCKEIKWITEFTLFQILPVVVLLLLLADVGHTLIKVGFGPAQDAKLQGDRKPFSTDINHAWTQEKGPFQSTAALEVDEEWLRAYFPAIPTRYWTDAWLEEFPSALLMRLAALIFLERGRNVFDWIQRVGRERYAPAGAEYVLITKIPFGNTESYNCFYRLVQNERAFCKDTFSFCPLTQSWDT